MAVWTIKARNEDGRELEVNAFSSEHAIHGIVSQLIRKEDFVPIEFQATANGMGVVTPDIKTEVIAELLKHFRKKEERR